MRCPHCNTLNTGEGEERCSRCGRSFINTNENLYRSLLDELSLLQQKQTEIDSGLKKMSQQVHTALDKEKQTAALPPPVSKPTEKKSFSFGPATRQTLPPKQTETQVTPPLVQKPKDAPVPPPVYKKPQQATKPAKKKGSFEKQVGQKWLAAIGILVTFAGVAYFLKYSFDQNWISPAVRVAGAYLWGLAFLAGGEMLRRKGYKVYGLWITGGGIATLYATTWAGYSLYGLMTQPVAFGVMILTTALSMTLAVVYDNKGIAVLGILGGFLTPVLLSVGSHNIPGLYSYILLLNLGVLGVAFKKRWGLLTSLAFAATWILVLVSLPPLEGDEILSTCILQGFFLVFTLIPFIGDMRQQTTHILDKTAFIPLPNTILSIYAGKVILTAVISSEFVGVITMSYALVCVLLATVLLKKGKTELFSFPIMIANTALCLALTVPIVVSDTFMSMAWAALAVSMIWGGLHINKLSLPAWGTAILAVAMGKFIFYDLPVIYEITPLNYYKYQFSFFGLERIINWIVLLGSLALGVLFCLRQKNAAKNVEIFCKLFATWGFAILSCLLFGVFSMETSSLFLEYMEGFRHAAVTILWFTFTFSLLWLGRREKQSWTSNRHFIHSRLIIPRKAFFVLSGVLLLFTGVKFWLYDYYRAYSLVGFGYFRDGFFSHWIGRYASLLVLGFTTLYSLTRYKKTAILFDFLTPTCNKLFKTVAIFAVGILFIIVNNEIPGFVGTYLPEARLASFSVVWTLFSAGLMIYGFRHGLSSLRITSLVLFAITLVKVGFVDTAQFATPYRIISFIVLGLVLTGCSFLYYQFGNSLEQKIKKDETEKNKVPGV